MFSLDGNTTLDCGIVQEHIDTLRSGEMYLRSPQYFAEQGSIFVYTEFATATDKPILLQYLCGDGDRMQFCRR